MNTRRLLAILTLALSPILVAQKPKDAYPAACVDCHTGEMRLTRLLAKWNGKADPKALAAVQAFAPKTMKLKGKHPTVTGKDIPASCIKCHGPASKIAPPIAPLLHGVHLAKGEQSQFVTKFGGTCTHCHKLNKATGTWSMPSGAEK